jgi:two-component system, NtrC family, response regulator
MMIRVLFIDPNDAERQSWVGSLGMCSADYIILQAADARSGLKLVESEQVDCVVLDLDLPDRNGLSVLLRLVDYAHRPRIAVVVLTCLALAALSEIAFRNGAQSYLIKGKISIMDLDLAIRRSIALVGPNKERHKDRPLHS